jgi:SlyX protein
MTDIAALSGRIDALEISKAHQDRAVEDLSEALARQWKEIETLNRQVARLREQVEEAAASTGGGEVEPPPPHY